MCIPCWAGSAWERTMPAAASDPMNDSRSLAGIFSTDGKSIGFPRVNYEKPGADCQF
jgi:hypothetical protein